MANNKYDSLEPLTRIEEKCEVCGEVIHTMSFKGTGVCGERDRKVRDKTAASNASKQAAPFRPDDTIL